MRLLLIVDQFDRSTLCEPAWWMWDVAEHAAAHGHRVEAITLRAKGPEADVPPGVQVLAQGGDGLEPALVAALARHPDVIHLATPGPLSARVIEYLRDAPLMLDVFGHWPVCPQNDLMRRPQYVRCDVRYPAEACGECAGMEKLREMEVRSRLLSRAPAIVTHARVQAERLSTLLGRAVDQIGFGVDTERFRPDPVPPVNANARALYETRGDRPRALFLGPPEHARGAGILVDLLVGVRARVSDATMVVVGRDPANPEWATAAGEELRELGLSGHIELLDAVAAGDLPGVIAACDVAISPSLWDDVGGLFVLQAFACGIPVVTTGRGGLAELVQHGSGMIASPDTPALFADRIAMLLSHDEARRLMGDAARLHAVEHHDRARSLEALDAVRQRVVEAGLSEAA
ncbi:MAG TPA: glycosyltransferase family 4 protein [Candidatus Sulfotelmatobacter sp.]|nr:glycosyltransferase family 4 protein [Candidatus Sulfotelmatobacter sp.]